MKLYFKALSFDLEQRGIEKGEKSNKYFLNLESHKKAKSSVRKVFNKDGILITNPKEILQEIEKF